MNRCTFFERVEKFLCHVTISHGVYFLFISLKMKEINKTNVYKTKFFNEIPLYYYCFTSI